MIASIALLAPSAALAAVVTNAADAYRTGWYPDQASLTPALVGGSGFALRFTTAIVGQVYAQPLVANRNALFIATEQNWIYRIDPETGRIQWGRQVAPPWNPADIGCTDLVPWMGITGTPVIDEGTNSAYFFSKTYVSGTSGPAAWWAHAVDLYTGEEQPNFPVSISGSAQNGGQTFNATYQLQRPGLILLDGVVYAAFGGICDISPWRGWVVGVSTSGQVTTMWTTRATLGGDGASIWQSGGGLVSDGPGRILFATGNGGSPATPIPGASPPSDLGNSVVRLAVQPDRTLQAEDFFTPSNAAFLDENDQDLGSGGLMAFPDAYFGTPSHQHLAVEAGKQGVLYVLDRDALGGCQQGPGGADAVLSTTAAANGVYSRFSVWPGDGGWIYFPRDSSPLQMYQYGLGTNQVPVLNFGGTSSETFGFGSGATVVTSNGTASGSALVWIVSMQNGSGTGAQLMAYDPVPVAGTASLRWSASVGVGTKFAPPGIAMSRVYVGARDGHVLMFGPTLIRLTIDKIVTTGSLHLQWTGGSAPFSLERAEDPNFTLNPTTLIHQGVATSFDDPVLNDGKTFYYRLY